MDQRLIALEEAWNNLTTIAVQAEAVSGTVHQECLDAQKAFNDVTPKLLALLGLPDVDVRLAVEELRKEPAGDLAIAFHEGRKFNGSLSLALERSAELQAAIGVWEAACDDAGDLREEAPAWFVLPTDVERARAASASVTDATARLDSVEKKVKAGEVALEAMLIARGAANLPFGITLPVAPMLVDPTMFKTSAQADIVPPPDGDPPAPPKPLPRPVARAVAAPAPVPQAVSEPTAPSPFARPPEPAEPAERNERWLDLGTGGMNAPVDRPTLPFIAPVVAMPAPSAASVASADVPFAPIACAAAVLVVLAGLWLGHQRRGDVAAPATTPAAIALPLATAPAPIAAQRPAPHAMVAAPPVHRPSPPPVITARLAPAPAAVPVKRAVVTLHRPANITTPADTERMLREAARKLGTAP